ncbi:hypothetical protein Rs2_07066 [Raphanus sativus]|nr:hypothetical protein Rs2_07066 [Raphanus sativus]
MNGTTGEVILGKQALAPPALSADLETFMSWADAVRRLKIMANADTPEDATAARKNGAEGIGLCRTENIFYGADRIKGVRKMIMAVTTEEKKASLDVLLPYQRFDFEGIFRAMDGLPVRIRLLDPSLHEFLPEGDLENIVHELAEETGMKEDVILSQVEKLFEVNPMLGFRGCRRTVRLTFCITCLENLYPELTEMQARAIFEAAASMQDQGVTVLPEIMVPLVGTPQEPGHQVEVGTMIEIPRAALIADEIAEHAEFFSFGTNDLTQMTFGYSRDDVAKFLPMYHDKGILQHDPFGLLRYIDVLDQKGVGQLVKMATERGRAARPNSRLECVGNMEESHRLLHSLLKQDLIMFLVLPSGFPLQG